MGKQRACQRQYIAALLLLSCLLCGVSGHRAERLRRSLLASEELPVVLPDEDQAAVGVDKDGGLEYADYTEETPGSAQEAAEVAAEVIAEKLESGQDQRQPVLESAEADTESGDPSMWTAEYARAKSQNAPAPSAAATADSLRQAVSSAPVTSPSNTSADSAALIDLASAAEDGTVLTVGNPTNNASTVVNASQLQSGFADLASNTTPMTLQESESSLGTALDESDAPPASQEGAPADSDADAQEADRLAAAEETPGFGASALQAGREAAQEARSDAAADGYGLGGAARTEESPLAGRFRHKKKHGHGKAMHVTGTQAGPNVKAAGQQEHDTAMPNVEIPKELQEDVKRREELAALSSSDLEDDGSGRAEPVNTMAAWAEHEKDYGAKLPPSVVEFEEEEGPSGTAAQEHTLPDEREVQYETPHKLNVLPGANFLNSTGNSAEKMRQLALSMTSAMRSATGTSFASMAVVAGAVVALLGVSVYYFRYMRGGVAAIVPNIIQVGKMKGPQYSRLRKQSSNNWEEWDNDDNWDDPGTGRMGEARHKKHTQRWDDEF